MSKLNEVAFLRSLSLDESETEQSRRGCPEPSILWALMQKDRGGSAMAEDLRNHIAVCPACRDLSKRLYAFHRASQGDASAEAKASYAEAQPRLNAWIDNLLASQTQMQTQMQTKAQPQPVPRTVMVVEPPRRFFRWSWGAPLVAALAVLVLVVILETRHSHPNPGSETAQIATVPEHAGGDQAQVGSTSGTSNDQTVLMKNDEADSASSEAPATITLESGEQMKLMLTKLEPRGDGSFAVEGELLPGDPGKADFDSVEVSGMLTPSQPQGRLQLKISSAKFKDKKYSVSGGGDISAVRLDGHKGAPQPFETLDIQIVHGQALPEN
jgi:hypothetical protein